MLNLKDELELRIEQLEKEVESLITKLKFQGLYDIPRKYSKFLPKEDEYPYFKLDQFKQETPPVSNLAINSELTLLKHPLPEKDRAAAKERMKAYAEGKDMNTSLDAYRAMQKSLIQPKSEDS